MKIIKLDNTTTPSAINQAAKILSSGGLVIYPTETCYGAGVDPTNQKSVDKLLTYKTKRQGKPLSIAVADQKMASKYVNLNTSAINLYQKFLPGPLTVISKSLGKVAKKVESDTKTIGIRIPDYNLVIKIIKKLGKPITATSANASYKPKPYSIKELLKNTTKKQQSLIDLIIDAGPLPKKPSSTVVDTTLDDALVLREGSVFIPGWSKLSNTDPDRKLITKSTQETINLAKTLMLQHWNTLQKQPLMFLLTGDLGTGKTQFSKGIGEFLGIAQPITSPTYNIEKEYDYNRHQVRGKFLHLDTWRLQGIEELSQLNLSSRLKSKTVASIEWADRTLEPLLTIAKDSNAKVITLKLETLPKSSSSHRRITFSL